MNLEAGYRILVIGASTGGPKVLREILQNLPVDLPVPVLIVQHISPAFLAGFVEWLGNPLSLPVKVAEDGEICTAGQIYVAAGNRHLAVAGNRLRLLDGEPRNFHRPSVDVLFESAAGSFGASVLGVLLTGMGNDGGKGSRVIIDRGGYTLIQNEESCTVFGMPFAAIREGGAGEVIHYRSIPERLVQLLVPTIHRQYT